MTGAYDDIVRSFAVRWQSIRSGSAVSPQSVLLGLEEAP